jgi:outer membrane protein TolC
MITRPLSLADALNISLAQNATNINARHDLEAATGIAIQTRAVLLPALSAGGSYIRRDQGAAGTFPGNSVTNISSSGTNVITRQIRLPTETWNTDIRVVQSIYEGGRMASALRSAKLTKQQALLDYQTAVADTLLATRVGYYDVLVAEQQIVVNDASVNLLTRERDDQQRRYDAGTVPRFNVLRAEVAVANARPGLIRARNDYRIAKNNMVKLLGYNLPREVWDDIPLQLTDKLEAVPYEINLQAAIQEALAKRTELASLRKSERLRNEDVVAAKSGYKPSVQAFAGYTWGNSQFQSGNLSADLEGWNFGGQLTWNIFDGMLTRGRVIQAKANLEKSQVTLDEAGRRVELEVRTVYSTFVEAKEVLESQAKVQEEAEEALRLANARADAGSGTQLDVLDAETSLTQARTTQVQALHDYAVARARLERAIGQDMIQAVAK